jgi:ParB-like chromosome segregation protein Spo0J
MSTELEFHPIANAFPLMTEHELAGLTEDIKANGLDIDIDLYQGKILEGRNRYRACKAAGAEVRTKNFVGDDKQALAHAISRNLKRKSSGISSTLMTFYRPVSLSRLTSS